MFYVWRWTCDTGGQEGREEECSTLSHMLPEGSC